MKRPTDPELCDLALGRLAPARREAIERACRRDDALRERVRTVRDHLARYDALVEAPEPAPPAFGAVAASLDDSTRRGRRAAREAAARRPLLSPLSTPWIGLGAVAAACALLVIVLPLVRGPHAEPAASRVFGVAARGIEVRRLDRRLEGPGTRLAPGDRLRAAAPAEATLGERVRVILDAGAELVLATSERVRLDRGRAFFEVAPGPFSVDTPFGTVEVLGTRFELVVADDLAIRVAEGTVALGETRVPAGSELVGAAVRGEVSALRGEVGAWFRRPQLQLAFPARVAPGTLLRGALVFANPSALGVSVAGPDPVKTSFWLEVETPDGEVLDLPLLRPEEPTGPLRAGAVLPLPPDASVRVPVHLARALDEEGVYRCRAMYRPEGRPPLVSGVVTVEVR